MRPGAPGGGAWPFRPALFLAASVVSANQPGHVTCDEGLKAHSVDGPPARVEGLEGFRWRAMGDEHGAVTRWDRSTSSWRWSRSSAC